LYPLHFLLFFFRTERAKLEKKREEWNAEVKTLSTQLEGLPRIKKNEIEELRRQATRLAHERDEASRNPRRNAVQNEIRQTEDKVHAVKRHIEDDRVSKGLLL
jgi:chromosome segregation ATPase